MFSDKRWVLFLLGLSLLVILSGCSLFGGTGGTGRLTMSLTDAPAADLKAVNVTITKVEVHRDDGWEVLNTFEDGLSVNLLDLVFDTTLLGDKPLPAGAYTQIRLQVDDSSESLSNVVDTSGNTYYLKVPSGSETGLKIHHNFTVPPGGRTILVLDANILDFVAQAGATNEFVINPTAVRVVDWTAAGTISGKVVDGNGNPITTTNVSVALFWDADNDGQPDDYNGDGSFAAADDYVTQSIALSQAADGHSAGEFRLNAVPVLTEGSYILTVSAQGYSGFTQTGIQVTAGEDTQIDGNPNAAGVQNITLTASSGS